VRFRIIALAHCPYQNKPISKTPHLTQRSSIYLLLKSRYITHYVPNFVAVATMVTRGKIRLASLEGPSPKTSLYTQKILRYLFHKPRYRQLCRKIRCHGKFSWQHSMTHPRKPPYWRKNLADISYTDRVIVNFVPNFVVMATAVAKGEI